MLFSSLGLKYNIFFLSEGNWDKELGINLLTLKLEEAILLELLHFPWNRSLTFDEEIKYSSAGDKALVELNVIFTDSFISIDGRVEYSLFLLMEEQILILSLLIEE